MWLWWFRFHSARSLEVDEDEEEEEEVKLVDEGGEDVPDAECLRYSLGEEVVGLVLSILPGTPSSEAEMWWERAESREELRTLDGLPLTGTDPSVC